MKSFSSTLLVLFLFLSGCAQSSSAADSQTDSNENEAAAEATPRLVKTTFMKSLSNPWDLAFASDATLFFTEKCRGLSVRKPNGTIKRLFGSSGAAFRAPDFFCQGQSGMNGVALDPQFNSNHTVYVFMLSNLQNTNRIVRLNLSADLNQVLTRTDIVSDIPFKKLANNWGEAGSHSGGRIRFGPDGYLYVTTGDNHNGTLPQDLSRLGGKVLRVDRNGNAAPGNNTPAGGDPRIYTYGHRNVQGLTFRPSTGQAFICEHGPSHDDEITPLRAGGNGGWDPKPEPGVSCADNYCGYISNKVDGTPTPMTDLEKFPDALKPFWDLQDAAGLGPCTFLSGNQWKSWNGALIAGIMADQIADVLTLQADGSLAAVTKANLPSDRMRSVVEGPDGNLYIATDSGSIWKVTPK